MALIKAEGRVFAFRAYLSLICFSILGHYLSLYLRQEPGVVAIIASFLTLISGLILSQFDYLASAGWKGCWLSGAVLTLGLTAEICGLLTGFPFGHYRYSERWWPSISLGNIDHFPLLLPGAWLMVVGACSFATRITSSKYLNCVVSGLLAMMVDLVMEGALAGRLSYWTWESKGSLPGGSPWTNSLSWFVIGVIASWILSQDSKPVPKSPSIAVLLGQVLLMLSLQIP